MSSKKVQPRIMPGDHTGKQIATYKASLEEKDRRVESFTAWLREKTANHFGSSTPLLKSGYGLEGVAVGTP